MKLVGVFSPVIGVAWFLAGCAAQPVGNELGGMVKADRRFTSTDAIFEAAEAHCKKFGKSARITASHQGRGARGPAVFECI